MKKIAIIVFVMMTIFVGVIPLASAQYYGVVKGKLKFFNRMGHFCPNDGSRSCVGSKYNQADFSKLQPIRDVKVYATINGQYAGYSSTDQYGNFTMGWSSTYYPGNIKIYTKLQHKDGRFTVFDSDGDAITLYGYKSVVPYTTVNNPQILSTMWWGSANNPNKMANTYNGAWRTWRYAFQYSPRMVNYFNGLDIWNDAASSVFNDATFRVYIGSSLLYELSVISHEMGHAAIYKAHKYSTFKSASQYCYPSRWEGRSAPCQNSANNSHFPRSKEWASAQFNEGAATLIGNVSQYWSSAPDPYDCISAGQVKCPAPSSSSFDLETSLGPACDGTETRYRLSTTTYMRDLYDSNGDSIDLNFYQMIEGIYGFHNHAGIRGKNEPWNSNLTALEPYELDGKATHDYQYFIDSLYNIDSDYIYVYNCDPI